MKSTNYIGLVIIVIAIFCLNVNPFKQTNAPMDILVSRPAWAEVIEQKVEIENEARSDIIDAILPNQERHKASLRKGYYKLRYIYLSGYVLKYIFKPDYIILNLFGQSMGFYLFTLFRLVLAGFGMFYFLKLFLNSKLAILFGSVTYMLGGFQSAWIYWPHMGVVMWFPWMLWAATKIIRGNKPVIHGVWLSLFSTSAIYAWFPSVAAYIFYALGIWCTWYAFTLRKSKSRLPNLILCLTSVIIAVFISSFLLFQQKEILFDTFNVFEDRINYGKSHLILDHLRLLFDPRYLGEPLPEFSLFSGRTAIILCTVGVLFNISRIYRRDNLLRIFNFSWILILIVLYIGWHVIDSDIIRWIPTFKHNPWQRITILLSFSLAVLSAIVLEVWRENPGKGQMKWINAVIAGTLLSLQVVDLVTHYRDLNGVSEVEHWYPTTPTIDYMKSAVKPNQRIMADNSFFIPGTLGYYGLKDWFAHGWKTKIFRDYLEKLSRTPHTTSTASDYIFDNVNLNSPFFDLMSVRFITSAHTGEAFETQPKFWQGPSIPIDLNNMRSVSVAFTPEDEKEVYSISALFGTFDKDTLTSESFSYTILGGGENYTGNITTDILNNEKKVFLLDQPIWLKKDIEYTLELNYLGSSDLAIWGKQTEEPKLGFNLVREYSKNGLKQVNQEENVILLENLNAPNGIYIVDSIHEVDLSVRTEGLALKSLSMREYQFTVDCRIDSSVWVVLNIPYRIHHQLKGANADDVSFKMYQGIFPAFKIKENGTYWIRYKPPYKTFSWLLSLSGLLSLGLGLRYKGGVNRLLYKN